MRAGLRLMVARRTRPRLAVGIAVASLCVVAETLVAALLKHVAPVHSLAVVYLLGIVAVALIWGVWLGMATAAISTLALDYFIIPPTDSLTLNKGEDWAVLAMFLAVTLLAGSMSKLGQSLAVEADARREADFSAELARILLHEPELKTARPAAARLLARRLRLSSAAIELQEPPGDDDRVAFPLRDRGAPKAWLLIPAGLPRPAIRRLRDRVVPSMEVLMQAARERERVMRQQVALRRLATLVAHRAPPGEVFDAVAREVGQVLEAPCVTVIRYEPDGMATNVGVWNPGRVARLSVGTSRPVEKGGVAELVAQTRAAGRIGTVGTSAGLGGNPASPHTMGHQMGIESAVGCPITVGGRLWGAVIAASVSEPLPAGTEARMLDFTELMVTSIVNAENLAKLEASRARVLAAADATRRLIERDLHDGAQQRLVGLMLELRATQAEPPRDPEEFKELLSHTIGSLDEALDELRGLARGLHPALLSRRGLEPAIKALARCSELPVELNLCADRLAERTEVTAYHVVSEALTNAVKYADASVVHIDLTVEDDTIRLSIRDDGKGGADPHRGSGLLGVRDRVEALGGRLEITSPVGRGTSLFAEIPVAND